MASTDTPDLKARLTRATAATAQAGLDALLVSPGPDLRYLTGYDAIPLERLTCLVVPARGEPCIVVPELEVPAAEASSVGDLSIRIESWPETADPYALTASLIPEARQVAVDDHMWAAKVLALRDAMPQAHQRAAGEVIQGLRMRKSAAEIEALVRAGEAIDAVHAQVAGFLRPGRTEREVGADIADAILAAGHATVDFVIVASGPNGASPHHELSDRVLRSGDTVVVDIGGTMPSGYCSDSTRMYALGEPSAQAAFERWCDRLARSLAGVVNLLDPDAIVLGDLPRGGLGDSAADKIAFLEHHPLTATLRGSVDAVVGRPQ